jgi:hypothetical protein
VKKPHYHMRFLACTFATLTVTAALRDGSLPPGQRMQQKPALMVAFMGGFLGTLVSIRAQRD